MTKKPRVTVAEYLSQQIAISGIAQREIAEALYYDKPNIITMFKQGKTKIPLNKIAPLAKVLGIDPVHFLRMAMLEYSPEIWEVLESLLGKNMISANEQKCIEIIREGCDGRDIAPKNEVQADQLRELFASWASEDRATAEAATAEYQKRLGRGK